MTVHASRGMILERKFDEVCTMKKAGKSILDELRGDNKERVMFYIDKNLQAKFKKVCGDKKIRMSSVVEKLIQNFLEEVKGEK